jgi:hypothetical protein
MKEPIFKNIELKKIRLLPPKSLNRKIDRFLHRFRHARRHKRLWVRMWLLQLLSLRDCSMLSYVDKIGNDKRVKMGKKYARLGLRLGIGECFGEVCRGTLQHLHY